MSEEKKMT
jgi:hypothetical protein